MAIKTICEMPEINQEAARNGLMHEHSEIEKMASTDSVLTMYCRNSEVSIKIS